MDYCVKYFVNFNNYIFIFEMRLMFLSNFVKVRVRVRARMVRVRVRVHFSLM